MQTLMQMGCPSPCGQSSDSYHQVSSGKSSDSYHQVSSGTIRLNGRRLATTRKQSKRESGGDGTRQLQ